MSDNAAVNDLLSDLELMCGDERMGNVERTGSGVRCEGLGFST